MKGDGRYVIVEGRILKNHELLTISLMVLAIHYFIECLVKCILPKFICCL